jgi:SSS family solute:Na+ symporter
MFDQLVILAYLLLTLLLGLYFKGSSSSSSKFLIFSEEIRDNRFILMASVFATAVGAGTIFGLTAKIFIGDISYAFGLVISIIVDLLVIFFLIPKIIKFEKYSSIGNIVEKYYDSTGKIIYGFSVILVSLGYLSAQIKISSEIFGHFTGMHNLFGVVLSYTIVIIYTIVGGMRSVILTDVMQFFFMIISIPYIVFCCVKFSGGVSFVTESLRNVAYDGNIIWDSLLLALSFSLMSINPPYLHRILVAGNIKHAQSSSYFKSLIYFIFIVMIMIIGLYAKLHLSGNPGNQILTLLIDDIIPIGLKGLVFCGILGALMSTADSNLHIASVSFIYDIILPIFKPNNNYVMVITRIFMVLFGVSSIILALNFQNVIDLVIFMSGFWGSIMFVPLIFLFYDIYVKKWQFLLSTIFGTLGFIYAQIYHADNIMKPSVIGAFINFVIFSICVLSSIRAKKV